MLGRRSFLAALATAPALPARAELPGERGGPLRFGADQALVDSGLARSLQRSFGVDTGIAVLLVPGPALAVLEAVKNGEVDVALLNVPAAEEELVKEGLLHDRRAIAASEYVLVGPVPAGARRPPPPSASGGEALARIRAQAASDPSLVFLSAGDGSGVHIAEQALWRTAWIEPLAPWYVTADPKLPFVAQVRARGAYALVERGAWAVLGGAPQAIVVEGDPQLVETVHAMRSFRARHPAGKIFVAWIGGGRGRAIVAAHRGYRPQRSS